MSESSIGPDVVSHAVNGAISADLKKKGLTRPGDRVTTTIGSTVCGAMLGSALGPVGTVVGGALGTLAGHGAGFQRSGSPDKSSGSSEDRRLSKLPRPTTDYGSL